MKSILAITLVFMAITLAKSQKFSLGTCQQKQIQSPFDAQRYFNGTWYQIAHIPFTSQKGKCAKAQYVFHQQNATVDVFNSEILDDGSTSSVQGTAYCDQDTARCHVKFGLSPYGDYEVFTTDYDNYVVVYGCQSLLVAKLEFMWILGRQRTVNNIESLKELSLKQELPYDAMVFEDAQQCSQQPIAFSKLGADCESYYLIANNQCADNCLASFIGICPRSIIVSNGGLTSGTCASQGYTQLDGQISQSAGPCGTIVFNTYSKPSQTQKPFLE